MIFTVGHSTQSYSSFLDSFVHYGVTAIADVRSVPFSRYTPQFNQSRLKEQLAWDGIAYVYLGDTLGGRPNDKSLTTDGIADYTKMANSPEFRRGLDRVIAGNHNYTIALMCAERDPIDCHRCLLVGRALHGHGFSVAHILGTGDIRLQTDIEEQLIKLARQDPAQADLFASDRELLNKAYETHARKVALREPLEKPQQSDEHQLTEG